MNNGPLLFAIILILVSLSLLLGYALGYAYGHQDNIVVNNNCLWQCFEAEEEETCPVSCGWVCED